MNHYQINKSANCILTRNIYNEFLKDRKLTHMEEHIKSCKDCLREVSAVAGHISLLKNEIPFFELEEDTKRSLNHEILELFHRFDRVEIQEKVQSKKTTKKLFIVLAGSVVSVFALVNLLKWIN